MRAIKHRQGGIGWLCRDCGMVVPDRMMKDWVSTRHAMAEKEASRC